MIDVATLSVIRRWALREQMSIREISRRTGLARNTVKKYLRAGDEEPRYARRASSSKLDPFADKLSTWLSIEATKSRKQRRTLLQLHTIDAKRPPSGVIQTLSTLSNGLPDCHDPERHWYRNRRKNRPTSLGV